MGPPIQVRWRRLINFKSFLLKRVEVSERVGPDSRPASARPPLAHPSRVARLPGRGSPEASEGWRRGWDSNPTGPFRFCKLQILKCRHCRECQRCRGALHLVAPEPFQWRTQECLTLRHHRDQSADGSLRLETKVVEHCGWPDGCVMSVATRYPLGFDLDAVTTSASG